MQELIGEAPATLDNGLITDVDLILFQSLDFDLRRFKNIVFDLCPQL